MTFYTPQNSFIVILLDTFEISIGRHHNFFQCCASLPSKKVFVCFFSIFITFGLGTGLGGGMKVRIEKQLNFKSIFQQFCKLSAWAPGRVEKVSLSSYPPASSYSCWCCLVQHWKQAIIDKALNMNSEWCKINIVPPKLSHPFAYTCYFRKT